MNIDVYIYTHYLIIHSFMCVFEAFVFFYVHVDVIVHVYTCLDLVAFALTGVDTAHGDFGFRSCLQAIRFRTRSPK